MSIVEEFRNRIRIGEQWEEITWKVGPARVLLAHIERLEALCDLAYSDGAQAGFNLGVTEDNDGLAKIIESRKDAVKALLSKGRKHE